MSTTEELHTLLGDPREDLSVEYKGWLDFTNIEHRATFAKAAIALANHGGGFIVIGMTEKEGAFLSHDPPEHVPPITQDALNAAIRRFASVEFHCRTYFVSHPVTGVTHPVVAVPGNLAEPVLSIRECGRVIAQNRCYIRKPGPRSEEPHTAEEWRTLLRRCVRAGRDDLLEAIRSIVTGHIEVASPIPDAIENLQQFCGKAYERWKSVVIGEPDGSPARFPHGYYEIGLSLVGAVPAASLNELQERLQVARRIKLTGWTPFLESHQPERAPYPFEDYVEAWVGAPPRPEWRRNDPSLCDFWRVSLSGQLYLIRGHFEDDDERFSIGENFELTVPIWRVGEALLFANRLAATFEEVSEIAIFCRYTGLEGRRLVRMDGAGAIYDDRISRADRVDVTARATPQQIEDNLAEIVLQLLCRLYERFNFFNLPMSVVESELARLRSRRF